MTKRRTSKSSRGITRPKSSRRARRFATTTSNDSTRLACPPMATGCRPMNCGRAALLAAGPKFCCAEGAKGRREMTNVNADVVKRAIEVIAGNSDESALDVLRDWVGAAASGGAAPSDPADEAASAESTEQVEDPDDDSATMTEARATGPRAWRRPPERSRTRTPSIGLQHLSGKRVKPAKVDPAAIAAGGARPSSNRRARGRPRTAAGKARPPLTRARIARV